MLQIVTKFNVSPKESKQMFRKSKCSTHTFVIVIIAFFAFLVGHISGIVAQPLWAADQPAEFALFQEAWDLVTQHFVDQDKIDFRRMIYGAIEGMLNTLGDENHTAFFSPEVAKQQANALEGSFEGIGAHVSMKDKQFKIIAPIRGSPAEEAGLLPGDIILAVDGQPVQGLSEGEVIARVRGPAGTTVVLTVMHLNATESVEIAIERRRIELDSVQWAKIPGIDLAYLQLTQFSSDTSRELERALLAIQQENFNGKPVRGIVLDLRNNSGGFLHEAIQVGSQFLQEGEVVLYERDAQKNLTVHNAYGVGLARTIPLIVLINQGTASAGEIFAGALQENGRAQLVGQTTIGTGTVLQAFELSDGSVIRLGVTNWLTPHQNLIKNKGIKPDIPVVQPESIKLIDATALQQMAGDHPWLTDDLQFNTALLLLHLTSKEK